MLTLRQKIFIASGIVVAMLLVIIFALLYTRQQNNNKDTGNNVTSTNQNVIDSNNPNIILNNNQIITKPDGTPEELYVKQMAIFFVERFFTYSNQNNNIHITELKSSASANMVAWMNTQTQKKDSNYSGVTSNVLSSKLTSFDKSTGLATVVLEITQSFAKEVGKNIEKSNEQKTVQVDFKLINNEWKVDGVWDVKI